MLADIFYQTDVQKPIVLDFLSQEEALNLSAVKRSSAEKKHLIAQKFSGKYGEITIISDTEGQISKVYIGTFDNTNEALAIASAVINLPQGCYAPTRSLSHNAMLAWSLAQYRFDRFKKDEVFPRILEIPANVLPKLLADAQAIFLVRDLINTPSNHMGPAELAEELGKLAKAFNAEFKQWIAKDLLDSNFPAIHTVGSSSARPPRFLSLVWGDKKHPSVVLIGKGVCFDTGGLDLKPAAGMRLMKKDMAGAAQVIGLAQWIMTNKIPIHLHVYIPAVENAVGPEAFRPGDVLTMRNGLTVEIHNTDAEGRLILADALAYSCEKAPELIFDFATLTGAARTAVGTDIAAMFVNNDDLANGLMQASCETNDPLWRLPLFDSYADLLNSEVADIANATDSPYAGAITAALFLKRFVTPNIPWAHFDIMAWNVMNKPGRPIGGEAMGIRAVGHYLQNKYGN